MCTVLICLVQIHISYAYVFVPCTCVCMGLFTCFVLIYAVNVPITHMLSALLCCVHAFTSHIYMLMFYAHMAYSFPHMHGCDCTI